MIAPPITYVLLTIGAIVAAVLTVQALRRIARNQERSVSLLEELMQQHVHYVAFLRAVLSLVFRGLSAILAQCCITTAAK